MNHCVFFRLQNNGPGSPKGTEKGSPLPAKQHSDLRSSYHHKSSTFQTSGPGHSDIPTDSESGLDWFHSLAGPVGGGHANSPIITSPITTSTQHNHNSFSKQARTLPKHPAVSLLGNSGAAHKESGRAPVCDKTPSITAEEEEVVESCKESSKSTASAAAEDGSCSVVQKVSKKLRDKRLRAMTHVPLQGDKAVGGGNISTSRDLIDHLDVEQAFSTDSLPSHSTPVAGKKRNSKKNNVPCNLPSGDQELSGTVGAGGEELHSKFTGFTFKPREKMTHTEPLCPDTDSSDFHTENRGPPSKAKTHNRENHNTVSSAREKEKTEKKKSEKQCYKDKPADGSSSALRLRVQSKEKEFPIEVSRDLNPEVSGPTAEGGDRGDHGTEQKRQQLLSRIAPGENRTTFTTSTDLPPLQPDHPKPTVVASTLAKLSRFSFTTTKDKEVTNLITTLTSGAQVTSSIELKAGQQDTWTQAITSIQQRTGVQAKASTEDRTEARVSGDKDFQTFNSKGQNPAIDSAVNPKKRKCFELGSKGLFSGLSMFSTSNFDEDDLSVDWDEESGKKTKM